MNKNLSRIAVLMISVVLVVLLYQTFILGQYSTYNYLAIIAFVVFLFISLYDMRNADDNE
ncbi:hypothetical protein [Methanobacterium sp.]|uniref:hypothetical protein n=1 Tax=Methanobacterium sp. TaxID=2164 RepID=UPI002AB8A976|nr:hypothetical protein [Methanobacterium sp.]MDY9924057.1 hypothetical protein [Methanobacterium sp.]